MLPQLPQPLYLHNQVKPAFLQTIAQEIAFVRAFVQQTYQRDISTIPFLIIPGLSNFNGQPGVYLGKTVIQNYWKPQINKQLGGEFYTGGPVVLIAADLAQNQFPNNITWGVIFHEFGHAALGADEPPAYACELMTLAAYVAQNPHNIPNLAADARAYVLGRRAINMYASFPATYDVAAKAAYQTLTGQPWQ